GCPQCKQRAFGSFCESCNATYDSAELVEPQCDRCKKPASVRQVKRWFFPLAPYKERLAEYHRQLRLSPKLRKLAAAWLDTDFAPAATQVGTWGIPAGDDQIISPWFEVALAGSYLRERLAADAKITSCFGYDNAFLYLVQDPAVCFALEREAAAPAELAANEFLLLDDGKMSTSRGNVLDADDLLARVPADLLRLYLAKMRPEDDRSNVNLATAQMFLTMIPRYWQGWLSRLGAALAAETKSRAPQPANASLAPWSHEQTQFLSQLDALVARARRGYDACSLKEVSIAIHELVERAVNFGAGQGHLAGVPKLETERATGLALELAAARTLAMLVAPVMPSFATRLWNALGYGGAIPWLDDVMPIAADQPIALANTQFFTAGG
ncbi:MAG TPA: class I tRNA ligase family protein, partial [Kofleriaceae bacterium]